MSASSGDTITVGPAPRARSSAVATKYTADFPHPVRCTTSARRRAATRALIAVHWSSRSVAWSPASARKCRSASSRSPWSSWSGRSVSATPSLLSGGYDIICRLRQAGSSGSRAVEPVSCGLVLDGELVFVPAGIPRRGVFALWGRGSGSAKLELVFPGGRYGIRKRLVSADLIPLAEALPVLLAIEPGERAGRPMRHSARVWAAAAAAGVGLVARGRLLPTVGAGDADVWRAGPLDPADLSWLRELAGVFPPTAHALAIPGSRPMRLRSPEALIRDLWDAIADLIARSPAAARTTASAAFAAAEPTGVGDLAEWLADTTDGLEAGARLGLRIEAVPAPPVVGDEEDLADDEEYFPGAVEEYGAQVPDEADELTPAFRLVLQLRSNADPSLIVDAAALWNQPETVLSRFGSQAETDLLLALRRGAPVWPPLAEALEQASPSVIGLDDDALASLIGPAAEELAGAGIEGLWPSSLVDGGLKLRAMPTPAPGKVTDAGFGLAALLDFRWQLTLDGALLGADEVATLAEAKRPLIRLRGRWVMLDPV